MHVRQYVQLVMEMLPIVHNVIVIIISIQAVEVVCLVMPKLLFVFHVWLLKIMIQYNVLAVLLICILIMLVIYVNNVLMDVLCVLI